MKKIKAVKVFLIIISVFMAFSFILLMGAGISEMRDAARSYTIDARDYVGDVRGKRYENLLETAERDTALNRTNHPEVEGYRALAQYFRTTVQAVAFERAGDAAAAEEMRLLADGYAKKCADYADYQEDIRSRVEEAAALGGASLGK